MLAIPRESHYPATNCTHRRLAAQLAAMIPDAVAIHVSLAGPRQQWPHPYAVAVGANGAQLPLSGVARKIAARWVLRTWPEADWTRRHTIDLVTGQLIVSSADTVRGR